MLAIPEYVKQLFRGDNSSFESWRSLEFSFFNSTINMLYPSNDLYPSETLYPIGMGEPWLVITDSDIVSESLRLQESVCSAQDLIFGACEASMLEFTVMDNEADLVGAEFAAVLTAGDYKMAYGIYTVVSVERQADRRKKKVLAFDRMIQFDRNVAAWWNSMYLTGDEVYTVKELRDSLCEYIGAPQQDTELINDGLRVGKTVDPDSLSGRNVLMAICEINGVFGHFDRTGTLTYVSLQETGFYPENTLYPADDLYPMGAWKDAEVLEHYRDIRYEDYMTVGIDRVQIRQEEGDIGAVVGAGVNSYIVEGNFLAFGLGDAELTQLAWSIYDKIGGRTYRPCKITTYAMPWVEPGDGIYVVTTDDEIATFVLDRTMIGFQAMRDVIQSRGSKERHEGFGIQSELIQLKGKSAVIKKSVEAVSVRVTDLAEHTEAQFEITANAITAEVTRAQEAEALLQLQADRITASVTDLKTYAEAQFLITSQQIALKVSKGDVSSQISVESDRVTISGNRLIVNSTNFKLDANGNATFSGLITGASIQASTITGGSINIGGGTFEVKNSGEVKIRSGDIEIGPLTATDEELILGDYTISANNTGSLISSNGWVEISNRFGSGPNTGPYAAMTLGGTANRTAISLLGNGDIQCDVIECRDVRLSMLPWGEDWASVAKNIVNLWNRVEAIENSL